MKDWTGGAASIYTTHGASNHSAGARAELDYYATDPRAVELLLEREKFSPYVWEPACGAGHISKVLTAKGYKVLSTDLVNRGYGIGGQDFLKITREDIKLAPSRDIITNPPYKYAAEFVEHALDISWLGVKVAMFLKLTFLEGAKRKAFFDKYPPKIIYVFRNRIDCWKNGIEPQKPTKAVCYAWFVWEKGYTGRPVIDWID